MNNGFINSVKVDKNYELNSFSKISNDLVNCLFWSPSYLVNGKSFFWVVKGTNAEGKSIPLFKVQVDEDTKISKVLTTIMTIILFIPSVALGLIVKGIISLTSSELSRCYSDLSKFANSKDGLEKVKHLVGINFYKEDSEGLYAVLKDLKEKNELKDFLKSNYSEFFHLNKYPMYLKLNKDNALTELKGKVEKQILKSVDSKEMINLAADVRVLKEDYLKIYESKILPALLKDETIESSFKGSLELIWKQLFKSLADKDEVKSNFFIQLKESEELRNAKLQANKEYDDFIQKAITDKSLNDWFNQVKVAVKNLKGTTKQVIEFEEKRKAITDKIQGIQNKMNSNFILKNINEMHLNENLKKESEIDKLNRELKIKNRFDEVARDIIFRNMRKQTLKKSTENPIQCHEYFVLND